jgi:hypothetical protein
MTRVLLCCVVLAAAHGIACDRRPDTAVQSAATHPQSQPQPAETPAPGSASAAAAVPAAAAPAASREAHDGAAKVDAPVGASFRNVNLHVDSSIVLEIRHIDGELLTAVPGRPPIFDDQQSFTLRIESGEVAMSPASLTDLMNRHVFAYDGAPLKNLRVSIENGQLRQEGTMHKGVDVPFTMLANVSATPDGRIRLHPTKIKTAGLPTGGLMKLFGLELDELIKLKRAPGVQIDENDFLLAPDRLLPSPKIAGHLTAVRIEADRIVEIFGPGKPARLTPPDRRARNFMYYRGGTLRFGKLTMSDADLQLIDADERDRFDFFPAHYTKQLVAGYSKNTPSGGLKVYMPDYDQASRVDLKPR